MPRLKAEGWAVAASVVSLLVNTYIALRLNNLTFQQQILLEEYRRQVQQTVVDVNYSEQNGEVELRNTGEVEASDVILSITTNKAKYIGLLADVIALPPAIYDTDVGVRGFAFNVGKIRPGQTFAVRLINEDQTNGPHPLQIKVKLKATCENCPTVER